MDGWDVASSKRLMPREDKKSALSRKGAPVPVSLSAGTSGCTGGRGRRFGYLSWSLVAAAPWSVLGGRSGEETRAAAALGLMMMLAAFRL